MNFIKRIHILLILSLAFSAQGALEPTIESRGEAVEVVGELEKSLMGFQEWKSRRVLEAKQKLVAFKNPQEVSRSEEEGEERAEENKEEIVENSVDNETHPKEKAEKTSTADINEKAEKLRQLEFNLEIAQGLTVHDYFALYLKDKSQPEMESAIQKLTASELSDLLVAYRTSLYGHPLEKKAEANLK